MKLNLLVITALVLGAAPFTLPAQTVEALAPATQPAASATDEVAVLIGQLGDDDFHVRLDAARRLKEMGPSVFPALKAACKSEDPEVHARIEDILHITSDVPQATAPGNQVMHVSIVNGNRVVEIQEPGRTIRIEQGEAGISMKVTGRLGGQQVTRTFNARTPEQLRRDNPQAFNLFQKFAGNGNIIQFGFQGNINLRLNALNAANRMAAANGGLVFVPVAVHQPAPPNGDNLERLQDKLLEQMRVRNLADPQQEEVKGLLKQLREGLQPTNNAANNADKDAQLREYDRNCDALRKKLADLNLPDPGEALPPPASARLGVTVGEESALGQGLVITHVLAGSRAEKLGLKDLDVIQKVNGKPVHSTPDLRKLVTDNPKGLIVEGLRDGQPLKLQE